jgi:hypothetical protein
MQGRTRQELYRSFVEFVRADVQRERMLVNRRMFNVFLWCFVLPAMVSVTLLLLVKAGILPRSARGYLDWLVLIFPVFYSLYILSSEVLAEIPASFRRGGISSTLGQAVKESEWRERVCDSLKRSLDIKQDEWSWLISSFRADLEHMRYRNKYMTALAGAVFFLIMQGIDSMTDAGGDTKVTMVRSSIGWVETSSYDLTSVVSLLLVLVLLYLSGNQTYYSLVRYLDCAELLSMPPRAPEA